MRLDALVAGVPGVSPPAIVGGVAARGAVDAAGAVEVRALTLDSRRVEPGALFAALPGAKSEGLAYVAEAARRGAVALLVPEGGAGRAREALEAAGAQAALALVEASAPRRALALMARRLHGAPDEALALVGITGTDGKTTTTAMLAAALEAGGHRVARGGTLGQAFGGSEREAALTTPEAPELVAFLAASRDAGADAAVLEVSSVALSAERVFGLRFGAGVLTTLGRDHLDVHGTLEAYHAAKRRLFEELDEDAHAILPADLDAARPFFDATRARVATFGGDERATWRISDHRAEPAGARFRLRGPRGFDELVETPRSGPWDARNVAAAVAAAAALGVDPARAARAAAGVERIAGRFERVGAGRPLAIVDYAHTPEALERVLEALADVAEGRVVLVFGCGGERDRGKRREMGRVAGRLAARVIVTDDNPRGEDPDEIARAVIAGVEEAGGSAERVARRDEAIARAVLEADESDALVVAGKGHERYQEIAGRRLPFDDRVELTRALARRAAGRCP